MKTTETVTLPLFFCFFSSGVAVLFSTTFCAEMQCRFFFAVFISFQCFVCAVIFHRVIFVCSLCSCSCDFVSFVKIFNMQLQGVLGIFQQRFVQKCNVGVYAVFINCQCFVCAVIFHRVIFVCWLCSCSCDFVSFVKIFNMQLQCVLGILQQRFVQKCNVGFSLQFSSIVNVLFVQ